MTRDFSPERLDVNAFAAAGASLAGDDEVGRFERLVQEAEGSVEGARVQWQAQGATRPSPAGTPAAWVHLRADARLPLSCQRCLMPMEGHLQVDRWFRFAADEAVAASEDEASEEDVLVASPRFDLLGLIEDELLMEMPAAPRHDECPVDPRFSAEDPDYALADAQKPRPFAALEALRGTKPR